MVLTLRVPLTRKIKLLTILIFPTNKVEISNQLNNELPSNFLGVSIETLGNSFRVRDTSPKTTLPKRHFAETTLCRMRLFAEILPKFGKNAEKDVFKSISYNVIFFFITFT